MIAFNKEFLDNTIFISSVKSLKDGRFISDAQYAEVKRKPNVLKTHTNIFFRLGFLLLGCLLYATIVGFFALFGMAGSGDNWKILLFFYAAVGIIGTEILARNKFYAHGLDDAFIIGFLAFITAAIGVVGESTLAACVTASVCGMLCCLRYLNTVSILVALVGISGIVADLVLEYNVVPKLYLSFLLLFLSVGIYFGYLKLKQFPQSQYYKFPLYAVQFFALFLGYFSVNYLVVRELSQELMGITVDATHDIPLAFLFYGLTFLIPIGFVFFAIRNKDRNLLWAGLLAFGFSIFTIRYYYHFMPPEVALLLGGSILFAISLVLINQLKNKESGITFQPDRNTDTESLRVIQAAIANSQAVHAAPTHSPTTFGGGGFSGGGAGETY